MSGREPRYIDGHGLILDGHAETLGEARQAARAWLRDCGASPFDAEQATELVRVGLAWWSGAELAFVGDGHEAAEPVTVVHIPAPPAPNRPEA